MQGDGLVWFMYVKGRVGGEGRGGGGGGSRKPNVGG